MKLADEVGLSISSTEPSGLTKVAKPNRHCALVGLARRGQSFYVNGDAISCPLGRFNLGLDHITPERLNELAKQLVRWNDAEDEETAMQYLKSAITLDVGDKYISYFPLENGSIDPDIVIKIGSPKELMQVMRSITRITGQRTESIMSAAGAMCGECTAIPVVTGKANVSLGCGGARAHAKLTPDQLMIALPIKLYRLLQKFTKSKR